jgi:hypothetical protein
MKVNKGDIIVCKEGFYGNPEMDHKVKEEPNYGGAGYVNGLMAQAHSDFYLDANPLSVRGEFNKDYGVFERAIRIATTEEKQAFEQGVKSIFVSSEEIYIPLKKGDIVVCLPWFLKDGNEGDSTHGGAGYEEGKIFKIGKTTNIEQKEQKEHVHWPENDVSKGIYEKALRHATKTESHAFVIGIKNISKVPSKKNFKISYVDIIGKMKKTEVEAFSELEAVSTLKDMKSVNYIMTF